MAKFKHPNVLGLVEPLIETKERMAFITERIDNSLLSMLKKNDKSLYASDLDIKIHVVIILLLII